MFKISILGQKGGTGKTTTGLSLAVAATRDGLASVIIDLDPQANAANWKDRRSEDNPAVVSSPVSRLKQTVQTAQEHGAEFVVIDTPGKSDSAAMEAARIADIVLLPVRPQIFDLETLAGMRDLLRVASTAPVYVILNGLHPQATKQADETKVLIEDIYGFPVCPVHLCNRSTYAAAPAMGKAPQEYEPQGRAAEEIDHLYMFITEQLNMLASDHEQKSQSLATGT